MPYSRQEKESMFIAAAIPSLLSSAASFILVLGCMKLKSKSSTTWLVIYLAICNFIVGLANCIPAYEFSYLCPIQGFLHSYFQNIACLTHALIAYCLYKSFSLTESNLYKRTTKIFLSIVILALPTGIYPLIASKFAYVGGWCAISSFNSTWDETYYWVFYFMRFFCVWTSNFYVIGCYYLIVRKYKNVTKTFVEFIDNKRVIANRMLLFPLALVFCYLPISIQRVYSEFQDVNVELTIVCIAIVSLAGVVNCLVYGISNPSIRYRLTRIVMTRTSSRTGDASSELNRDMTTEFDSYK